MPVATELTLQMLIAEHERIRVHMVTSYPDMVKREIITPYERDHRLKCNKATLTLLRQLALQEKDFGKTISQIINRPQ